MKKLPYAEIYEKEFKYWPWGKLVREVCDTITEQAPKNAKVVDLLCGPGYLLNRIHQRRKDLELSGVDINDEFIKYARQHYPGINFTQMDILKWSFPQRYDVVVCTAGLHHLPFEEQGGLVKKAAQMLKPNGLCIFGDPMIRDYSNERERAIAAAELGYKSLVAVVENGGDRDMIQAALDVMHNDVLVDGEFKTSPAKVKALYGEFFPHVEMHKTWPLDGKEGCGDYYFVLRNTKE